jgi:hypothetical protein
MHACTHTYVRANILQAPVHAGSDNTVPLLFDASLHAGISLRDGHVIAAPEESETSSGHAVNQAPAVDSSNEQQSQGHDKATGIDSTAQEKVYNVCDAYVCDVTCVYVCNVGANRLTNAHDMCVSQRRPSQSCEVQSPHKQGRIM